MGRQFQIGVRKLQILGFELGVLDDRCDTHSSARPQLMCVMLLVVHCDQRRSKAKEKPAHEERVAKLPSTVSKMETAII